MPKSLKYQRIKEYIVGLAVEQGWTPGHKLPSEYDLVRQFEISRTTVRQAFDDLEQEGIIQRKRGQGTFLSGKEPGIRGRQFLIGITVSNTAYIYTDIIQGAERVLVQAGYHLVIGRSTLSHAAERKGAVGAVGWIPDGHLLELWQEDDGLDMQEVCRDLSARKTPYVLMNWVSDDPAVSFVAPHDREAGATAYRHLRRLGHTRIAYVGIANHQPALNRLSGLKDGAGAEGRDIPERYIRLYDGHEPQAKAINPHAATRQLLALGRERPTAIFYFNDEAASRGYQAIREAGLLVPDDVSVIGFDDSQISQAISPPLTTLAHPKGKVGESAARILLDRIESPESFLPSHVLYTCRLVERGSVRTMV